MRILEVARAAISIFLSCFLAAGVASRAADCNGNGQDDSLDILPGNIGFPSPPLISLSRDTYGYFVAMVSADLDRNGAPDLAVLDQVSPARIVTLRNRGDGSFVEGPTIPAEEGSVILEVADLDGDGDADLISTGMNETDGIDKVLLYRNRGDGTFDPAEKIPADAQPRALAAEDLDGDGRIDLAIGNQGEWVQSQGIFRMGVRILWNRTGGFQDGGFIAGDCIPLAIAAGDLDSDGDADLVVSAGDIFSRHQAPFLLRGDGKGSLGPPEKIQAPAAWYRAFCLDDLDGNGSLEIIAGGVGLDVAIFTRGGDGKFAAAVQLSGEADGLATADLDGDGRREIIASDDQNGIRVHRNLGGLSFESGPGLGPDVRGASVADFDADGDADVAGVTTTGTVFFLVNPGNGIFPMWRNYPTGEDPLQLVTVDFDEDGDRDVALVHDSDEDDRMFLFLNDGSGAFGPPVVYLDPFSQPSGIATADVDGDGRLDVVGDGGGIWYRPGRGKDLLGDAVIVHTGGVLGNPVALDLDRDGDVDIAGCGYHLEAGPDLHLLIFRNRGGGAFEDPVVISPSVGYCSILAADLDGEDWLDLVLLSGARNALFLVRGGPDGFLPPVPVIEVGQEIGSMAIADFDLDQDVDLALSFFSFNPGPGKILILENDGMGNLMPGPEAALRKPSFSIAAGDMDGDGDMDLVATESFDRFAMLLNRGDGTFAEPLSTLSGTESWVFAADMDGDAIADVLCLDESQGALAVHLNPVIPPVSRDLNRNGVPDECEARPFHRGDPNGDGQCDLSDAIGVLGHLFLGEAAPACKESADSNNDGALDISDPIYLLLFLFQGGPPPAAPGPPGPGASCGLDPDPPGSPGDLGCVSYGSC